MKSLQEMYLSLRLNANCCCLLSLCVYQNVFKQLGGFIFMNDITAEFACCEVKLILYRNYPPYLIKVELVFNTH